MDGMAQNKVGVDPVAIAPSLSFLIYVSAVQQVGDYLPRRPFCDADSISQIAGGYPGVASDIAQHHSMIGEKCPLRHIPPPVQKLPSDSSNFPPKGLDKQHSNIVILTMIHSSLFMYHELGMVFEGS
jgi:hypothetical protein